jgi:Na+/H+ antiporter NhaC
LFVVCFVLILQGVTVKKWPWVSEESLNVCVTFVFVILEWFFVCLFCFVLFCFGDRVSLCSSGCPWTQTSAYLCLLNAGLKGMIHNCLVKLHTFSMSRLWKTMEIFEVKLNVFCNLIWL